MLSTMEGQKMATGSYLFCNFYIFIIRDDTYKIGFPVSYAKILGFVSYAF